MAPNSKLAFLGLTAFHLGPGILELVLVRSDLIKSDLIITLLKRLLKPIKIQSDACQDLKTVYYSNSCIMMRKNMFCFNLFGEETWHFARLQGGKYSLVPTPSELHPVSHCLSDEGS